MDLLTISEKGARQKLRLLIDKDGLMPYFKLEQQSSVKN
jgi:hypothetical protein